jgi:hypothetical protein
MPGDIDRFCFPAKQGTRLVILAAARDVIPFLADAVPGWFQAVITLRDSAGNEVSYADSFQYRQDPALYVEVPRDDRYTMEIRDSLYRGREDFVYRVTVGEIPIVTGMFPLGAPSDASARIELTGWNLTQTSFATTKVPFRQFRPVRWFTVPQGSGGFVQVPVQMDRFREVFDKEPNNDAGAVQRISARTIVNGRIDWPGDEDVFHISDGGRVAVEVFARRQGSPLDAAIELTDAKGNELAFNDDREDKAQGLSTHHADSYLVATLPASGGILRLYDVQGNGGQEFVYRLHVRPPEPDFELRVTPGTIIARAGAVIPITAFALREDNFREDIELGLVDAPPGFQLSGGVIPGNADHVQLTLTVPAVAPQRPVVLTMVGSARRNKSSKATLVRPAIPAENMMQAFIWYHLVPVEDWIAVVSGRPGTKPPYDIFINGPRLRLPLGDEVFLPIRPIDKTTPSHELRVELNEPNGITAEVVSDAWGGYAVKLTTNTADVKPGLRGNLLLYAYRETQSASKESADSKPQRTDYGYFPALPFEVTAR